MDPREPVETHIQIIWSFVRLVVVKRALADVLPETKIDFWRIIQGASLDLGLIEWCKVFGSNADDTHWTKAVPAAQHDDFRKGLFAAVGMTDKEWEAYWKKMTGYRNELAAHHDLNAKTTHYPNFDAALEASYYYYNSFLYPEWVAKNPRTGYPADLKAYVAGYNDETLAIVKAAAAATQQFEP
ncbi:hypothetical protein P0D75_18430 [Paraburkholderia sediminicola]|uniref:hypothetical protein n=1 Tax=Paraburkholderia sediminicola TaxID=458836 RepID=UPI0038BD7070